jgi:hypothetical protein
MTDYSYIFLPEYSEVFMSIQGQDLLDAVKIIQGATITEAMTFLGPPIFPVMIEQISYEEMTYGSKLTTSI